jgi:hypothetical protein
MVRLPDPAERAALLGRLAVPALDADEILASWPDPDKTDVWRLVDRLRSRIVEPMGNPAAPPVPFRPPRAEADADAWRRWLPVLAYLAALPDVRAYHRERAIPDEISWATLADLGRHVAIERRATGAGGLDAPWWLSFAFRGVLYELGRLQFARSRITPGTHWPGPLFWQPPDETDAQAAGLAAGDHALQVHIPDGGGLSPAACDASFADAATFFPRHFPDEPVRIAICTSWLLDPQLAEYLPAESNIVPFQRRFQLVPGEADGDASVLEFVFRRPRGVDLERLPQRTTLERAVVAHLRAGRQWAVRTGWLELSARS